MICQGVYNQSGGHWHRLGPSKECAHSTTTSYPLAHIGGQCAHRSVQTPLASLWCDLREARHLGDLSLKVTLLAHVVQDIGVNVRQLSRPGYVDLMSDLVPGQFEVIFGNHRNLVARSSIARLVRDAAELSDVLAVNLIIRDGFCSRGGPLEEDQHFLNLSFSGVLQLCRRLIMVPSCSVRDRMVK